MRAPHHHQAPARPRNRAALALALLVPLAMPLTGAAASTPAKSAWDDLRLAAELGGLQITARSIEMDGAAMILQSVTVTPIHGRADSSFALADLRIDPQDDGRVALRPAVEGMLTLVGLHGRQQQFRTHHDGAFLLLQDGTEDARDITLTLDFGELIFDPLPGNGAAPGDGTAFAATLAGVAGDLSLTLAEEINASGALSVDTLSYSLQEETHFPFRQTQQTDASATGLELTFDMQRLDFFAQEPLPSLSEMIEGGMRASLTLLAEASASRSLQQSPLFNMALDATSGPSTLTLEARDGLLEMYTDGEDMTLSGSIADMPLNISGDSIAISLSMPIVPSDTPGRFETTFSLAGIALTQDMLAALDAPSLIGETAEFEITASAAARWRYDPTAPDAPMHEEPLDLSALVLDRLMLRLSQARLEGEGRLALDPEMPFLPDGNANGTGTFIFELEGGDALLQMLAGDGTLADDQLFLGRMMMNMLGRSVGPDRLRSEIEVTPGNVLINGLPVPF